MMYNSPRLQTISFPLHETVSYSSSLISRLCSFKFLLMRAANSFVLDFVGSGIYIRKFNMETH